MQNKTTSSGMPPLVDQPKTGETRKKNAWWRQPRINRSVRRLPYVISEGEVWFGRKVPGGRAWTWLQADEAELSAKPAANDSGFGRSAR